MSTEMKTCPVCNGSTRAPAPDVSYKRVMVGYDVDTDTVPCKNCGGQYMFGRPTGKVRARPDGTACTHSYVSSNVGRCLTNYTCKHCSEHFTVDSGD